MQSPLSLGFSSLKVFPWGNTTFTLWIDDTPFSLDCRYGTGCSATPLYRYYRSASHGQC
ncbi:hypothetical protein SERLADRAFT_370479 [Serpula lacrymans var. lacrymans S7.9]|uniref:Uncharacterized protein n=1 Tax=Serpula lacrymans var. lacrymans (strain S7.9) TaxID=578457 RepID=F8NYE8_SERL9|nr:uncharacterized protein SERLADRAFT_370479 [Serpula lacrymans var. lacrymans S7.9]EGO23619.1 hypothetical protein SERLADRAFT_370479 [Serpula lacrymans var. lacrymans S7.9]